MHGIKVLCSGYSLSPYVKMLDLSGIFTDYIASFLSEQIVVALVTCFIANTWYKGSQDPKALTIRVYFSPVPNGRKYTSLLNFL